MRTVHRKTKVSRGRPVRPGLVVGPKESLYPMDNRLISRNGICSVMEGRSRLTKAKNKARLRVRCELS